MAKNTNRLFLFGADSAKVKVAIKNNWGVKYEKNAE